MKHLLQLIILLTAGTLCGQNMEFTWGQNFGGPEDDRVRGMALDNDGNLLITGLFTEQITIGQDSYTAEDFAADSYFAKLDPSGNVLWSKALQAESFDDFTTWAIKADPDNNIIVAGSISGDGDADPGSGTTMISSVSAHDIYVSKFTAEGELMWVHTVGGDEWDRVLDMDIDDDGNIYMAGYFGGSVDFDPGTGQAVQNGLAEDDPFVYKLNSDGSFAWVYTVPTEGTRDGASSIIVANGFVHVSGYFRGQANFPSLSLNSGSNYNSFFAKMTTDGSLVWLKTIGTESMDDDGEITARSIDVDQDGNVLLTGGFDGDVDFDPGSGVSELSGFISDTFIAKYNSNGEFIWANMIESFEGLKIIADKTGAVYFTGEFSGSLDVDPGPGNTTFDDSFNQGADSYIVKLDPAGSFVTAAHISGPGSVLPKRLLVDEQLNLYLGVDFLNRMVATIGNSEVDLSSNGEYDFAVLMLDQSGTTSTKNLFAAEARLFPNPCSDYLELINKGKNIKEVNIVDPNGRLVLSLKELKSNKIYLPATMMPGMYFLELVEQDETSVRSFIKQ